MSSNVLSRPLDVTKFAVIIAGAQKNMGPAGVTVVIVRDDLLGAGLRHRSAAARPRAAGADRATRVRRGARGRAGHALPTTPVVCNYQVMAENDSMYNTAPTYSIYITALVMEWLVAEGGIPEMDRRSERKARLCGSIAPAARAAWHGP